MMEPKPIYLLAGGPPRSPSGMVSCLRRALNECGQEKPRVAYIGTASGDNALFFAAIQALLHEAGAGKVELVHLVKPNADTAAARQALEAADAVFISGGEVEDGMLGLARHGLQGFLKELYQGGKLFIGVSAGAIMLGTHWVRWADPDDDATASLFECLGFVPTVFDTHAEDEDWRELKTALRLMGPGAQGYGIPRDGMLSADGCGRLTSLEKEPLRFVNDGGRVVPLK